MSENIDINAIDAKQHEKNLLELYPLMNPGKDLSYSKFITKCEEMYATFALRNEFNYPRYIHEMLIRARKAKVYT
jgi:hypothetical protein